MSTEYTGTITADIAGLRATAAEISQGGRALRDSASLLQQYMQPLLALWQGRAERGFDVELVGCLARMALAPRMLDALAAGVRAAAAAFELAESEAGGLIASTVIFDD